MLGNNTSDYSATRSVASGSTTPSLSTYESVTPYGHVTPLPQQNNCFLNKYVSIKELGKGAYGSVLLAKRATPTNNPKQDPLQQQPYVAIKCQQITETIPSPVPSTTSTTSTSPPPNIIRERLNIPAAYIRELMVLQTMTRSCIKDSFPFLVQLLDHGKDVDRAYLVLEYCPSTLACSLREHSCFSMNWSAHITYQLTLTLAYLSIHGIMHRDMKPSNIMLQHTTPGNPPLIKLIDFGLARREWVPARPYSPAVQTVIYRAPEVFFQQEFPVGGGRAGKLYTSAIDVWSVACIFAECLTGKQLFKGESEIAVRQDIVELSTTTLGRPEENCFEFETLEIVGALHPGKSIKARFQRHCSEHPGFLALMEGMFEYSPKKRLTPSAILLHPFFASIKEHYERWVELVI
ncbi:Cyclin-dependent kinase 4 [Rhizoclosmatium sp. JEL0117]|nr:Cyclin-dependent kinase 4 [Rhizoclosmatium sp. JEL0117]